jgi:hypothetical protein
LPTRNQTSVETRLAEYVERLGRFDRDTLDRLGALEIPAPPLHLVRLEAGS